MGKGELTSVESQDLFQSGMFMCAKALDSILMADHLTAGRWTILICGTLSMCPRDWIISKMPFCFCFWVHSCLGLVLLNFPCNFFSPFVVLEGLAQEGNEGWWMIPDDIAGRVMEERNWRITASVGLLVDWVVNIIVVFGVLSWKIYGAGIPFVCANLFRDFPDVQFAHVLIFL